MLCARPSVAPLPMTLVSTRNVTHTCNHRTDNDRCYENIVYGALVKHEETRSKEEKEGEEASLKVELQLRRLDYRKIIWRVVWTWKGDTPLARGVPFLRQAYKGTEAGPVPPLIVWANGRKHGRRWRKTLTL